MPTADETIGQREAEQHRDAEAVDHARQHVARLVVGAEQVAADRRRRRRARQVLHDGVVAVRHRRPDHPAMRVDRLLHFGIGVVGLGRQEVGAERVLAVVLQHRHIPVAIEADQQRAVVGDELGEQADAEQDREDPERPVAAPVLPEDREPAAGERRELQPPRLEVDARIDHGVEHVADDLHQQAEQGEDVERAEHHRIVALDRRLEAEQAEAVEREDDLHQQRRGEQDADERRREAGDDQQHGVAEHVAVQHALLAGALGARGDDVLLADLLEEAVLGQHGQAGETADHQRDGRQHHVPGVVGDARRQAPVGGAFAGAGRAAGTTGRSCRRRTARPAGWRTGSSAPRSRPAPTALVATSKRLPSRTALAMPSGMETR